MNYHVELTPSELVYLELLLEEEILIQSYIGLKTENFKNLLKKLQRCTTLK